MGLMKGPYERLKYDLRRVWECPVCGHRERTGGHVTQRLCRCQQSLPASQRRFMKLIADGIRRVDGASEPPRDSSSAQPEGHKKTNHKS